MRVFQIRVKVFMLKDVTSDESQNELCKIIDTTLIKDRKWNEFHNRNEIKNYCFDSLFPIEKDCVYKTGKIYSFTIRTTNRSLADYLNEKISHQCNDKIKCLVTEIKILPKKLIEKVYCLTPAIVKSEKGYWKGNLGLNEFERRINLNLIKKYSSITGKKLDEDYEIYTCIEFKNKKPCKLKYKNITLLGDKISLSISGDPVSQEIAYMALGTGVGETNSRGAGFLNCTWI